MLTSERNPEQILRRLEWTVLRRLDGLLQGDYRTFFRGFGLDLAELREYQLHDDVRYIDWNVTARLQTPYVRQYNEDREVTAWFLLDVSPSVDFGSMSVRKRDVLTEFVGVMAALLARHGNRIGAMYYSRAVEAVVPPAGGRAQVLHILDVLRKQARSRSAGSSRAHHPQASATTNLDEFLRASLNAIKRRAVVFLLSDFFSTPGWDRVLGQLAARHEVLAVRVFDPLEVELPDVGLIVMSDSETGEQILVDTHDRAFRNRFAQAAEEREARLRTSLIHAGVDALELSTRGDLVEDLVRYAALRKQQSRLAAGVSM
jgi:uncharacterized protein (DUF58 family)